MRVWTRVSFLTRPKEKGRGGFQRHFPANLSRVPQRLERLAHPTLLRQPSPQNRPAGAAK